MAWATNPENGGQHLFAAAPFAIAEGNAHDAQHSADLSAKRAP